MDQLSAANLVHLNLLAVLAELVLLLEADL
jgi:hypothetical protein